jgi:hypothetical protein
MRFICYIATYLEHSSRSRSNTKSPFWDNVPMAISSVLMKARSHALVRDGQSSELQPCKVIDP